MPRLARTPSAVPRLAQLFLEPSSASTPCWPPNTGCLAAPQVCMIETYKERQQNAEKQRQARQRYLARCKAVQELERQVGCWVVVCRACFRLLGEAGGSAAWAARPERPLTASQLPWHHVTLRLSRSAAAGARAAAASEGPGCRRRPRSSSSGACARAACSRGRAPSSTRAAPAAQR